jgi:hypothetical protein
VLAACTAAAVAAAVATAPASGAVLPAHHARTTHHTRAALSARDARADHTRRAVRALRHRQAAKVTPAAVSLPALVSTVPADWTPNVFAGSGGCSTQWFGPSCTSTVYSMAVVNGEVVVAGAFTQVCEPGPSNGHCAAGTTVTRNDIFAYRLDTGAIDPNFAPVLDQGPVTSVVAGPGNTVYAGGSFSRVNGAAHSGVVQLSVTPGTPADGAVVPAFGGQLGGTASSLALNGNALYVGGKFRSTDGTVSSGLSRLDATTGAVDPKFPFTLSNPVSGTPLEVRTLAVTADGGHLAIAGTFLTVNGQSRPRIAVINTGGGLGATASLANWSAPLLANNCSKQHDYVTGIDFSPDGSFFVVSTTGYKSAGGASICDAAARFETGASGTNVQPTWVDYTGGDSLHSVAVAGSVVYVGGHQRWVNNECGDNRVCEANAVMVNGVAALDAHTGLALPWWQPGTLRGAGVQALVPVPAGTSPGLPNGGLLLGTDVNLIGGGFHSENALFPGTTTTAQTPGGPIPSGMFSQGRVGGLDETSRGFAARCVDAAGNGSANGTKVQFWTCMNDASQNWTLGPGGTIQINGKCLDAAGGSSRVPPNGTKVQLWSCSGGSNQQWHQGTGGALVNGNGGKCLDDPSASMTNGVQLQLWSCTGSGQQTWPLPVAQAPPPPPVSGPVNSALLQTDSQIPCLDDPAGSTASGTSVVISECRENPEQIWTIQPDGTIRTGGLCLDTAGGATGNGTPVALDSCNGNRSQMWQPGPNYALVNKASGTCLDVAGSNTTNGAPVQIWACNGGLNQQWRLPAD